MTALIEACDPDGFSKWVCLTGRLLSSREDELELAVRATATSQLTEIVLAAPHYGLPRLQVSWDGGARAVDFDGTLRLQTPRHALADHGLDVLLRRPQLALDDDYVDVLDRDGRYPLERLTVRPRPRSHVVDAGGRRWPADHVADPWILRAPALVSTQAERYELLVDHPHGVIVSCSAWIADCRLASTDLLDLHFDVDVGRLELSVPGPVALPAQSGWQELPAAG